MKKVIIVLSVFILVLLLGLRVNDIEDAHADGECAANCTSKKKETCGFVLQGEVWACWGWVEKEKIPE